MVAAPYLAASNLCQAFLPDMLERRAGLLIHVGSPASRIPWPAATSYTAMRWALRGLHEALCQDLVGTGVRSCHVVFGEVSSPYFGAQPDHPQSAAGGRPVVPVVTPERCAEVILRTVRRPRREVVHPFMPPAVLRDGGDRAGPNAMAGGGDGAEARGKGSGASDWG